jgi:hypothetical protein
MDGEVGDTEFHPDRANPQLSRQELAGPGGQASIIPKVVPAVKWFLPFNVDYEKILLYTLI